MSLVSVIIPTYNRFTYLINAIKSVKNQTYKNIEIIVVNDCSTQLEYYNYKFNGCRVLHLPKNSREIYGFNSPGGYARNQGVKIANGKYIAFLDDDDVFLPHKIETQVTEMERGNFEFSATEGYFGHGKYNPNKKYPLYNREHYWDYLSNKLSLENDFPNMINKELLTKHNIIIASSVMMTKELFEKTDGFPALRTADDYALWLQILDFCDCLYVKTSCMYYDAGHGDGQNY